MNNAEIQSGKLVPKNTKIEFRASPDDGYWVHRWTNGYTVISKGRVRTEYTHRVMSDVFIRAYFRKIKTAVYVTESILGSSARLWEIGEHIPIQLRTKAGLEKSVVPEGMCGWEGNMYIVGNECGAGAYFSRIWKQNGSLYWDRADRENKMYDIAVHKKKLFAVGKRYFSDGNDFGASLTDISNPNEPSHIALSMSTTNIDNMEARALCSGDSKLYAAGYKKYKDGIQTAFLWTRNDKGQITETDLGPIDSSYTGKFDVRSYGNNGYGDFVYVAAGEKVWYVHGSTVTPVTFPTGAKVYAIGIHTYINDDEYSMDYGDYIYDVYFGGETAEGKAAIWQETYDDTVSLERLMQTGRVQAMCFHKYENYICAAGRYKKNDMDNKYISVWREITDDNCVTHEIGHRTSEATDICVLELYHTSMRAGFETGRQDARLK